MKQSLQNIQKLADANLSHIQKLNLKIYKNYIDLLRLYSVASGKKSHKFFSKKRSVDDEIRLLSTVENKREQIKKVEDEIKTFIDKYL